MSIPSKLRDLLISAALSSIVVTTSSAAPSDDSGVTIFSDLCYHAEAGDLLGARVILLRLKGGDYVVYQIARGELAEPQIVSATVGPKNAEISFKIAQPDEAGATFRGKMTAEALTGSFDNKNWTNRKGEQIFRLPRIVGRQQSYPACS
ncbi:hypothetical protein TSA1_33700 [Bradyrhizobium nitroreducens]|uniref:Uncharacterized protein n=1 Tax=Bradyrhizobium nitroreducens TaxID=709803 RepID=A0A2M6UKK0_9BRAD|nr:hypothetical protein [Bradyrhizobium nitroreducens]PIT05152.1 hypothetical protein TSA1_33700 [Bradyrhizobium nitroreducens]